MEKIVGTIDNASKDGSFYHLIFTPTKLLVCMVMDKAEFKKTVKTGKPVRTALVAEQIPIEGHVMMEQSYFNLANLIYSENRARGKEIEENLDSFLGNGGSSVTELEYASISLVELRNRRLNASPNLIVHLSPEKMRFRIVGSFSSDFLPELFGEKFVSK